MKFEQNTNLEIGDTFRVTQHYGKRVFNVVKVLADGGYSCDCGDGTIYFFDRTNFDAYNKFGQFIIVSRTRQSAKLENAKKALESAHVQSVQCGFEYESAGTRYYSAITNDSGFQHLYNVRVWADSDGATFARCNCAAVNECRHIARVAKLDAQRCGRNVYYGSFENYSAYKQPLKAAA